MDDNLPCTGRVLADSLVGHGVDRIFTVAGESYLSLLDALRDMPGVDVVTCRHEGSAGFMALADAKLTSRSGVCLVSRGPGAANAAIAAHAAAEDATPLVLLVGGVTTGEAFRESFQDFDPGRMFGGMAKAVWAVLDPDLVGEFVARAFALAEAGTPGPVVVMFPEDILIQPSRATATARGGATLPGPAGPDLDEVLRLLAQARQPLLLAGSRLNRPGGRPAIAEVAARHALPVLVSNKNQHLFDNRDPRYAGHLHNSTQPAQLAALGEADLIIAVGTRLDTVTTKDHAFPLPHQALVHVYPDAARVGGYHATTVGLIADPVLFLQALAAAPPAETGAQRQEWINRLHAIERKKAQWHPVSAADGVVFGTVGAALDEQTGGEVTVVVDSGTFTSWIYRYVRFGKHGRLVGISSSTMGFGVPGAVACALRDTSRPVVAVTGDGGFMMNPSELITAVDHQLPLVVIVANNGSYGTIRLHQERQHPGRVMATDLVNPDFARLAEAFGATGLTATTDQELAAALTKALACNGPVVIDVKTSLRHITAYKVLETAPGERV